MKPGELLDLKMARYSAVISDLHLCEEEPVHPRHPLWKKYKTREFFFDTDFVRFLDLIQAKAKGERVELILNGDIFDFDSVMAVPQYPPYRLTWLERKRGMHAQEEKSVFKIRRILEHHAEWVRALRDFILKGNCAVFIIGNHDLELHFPAVQQALLDALALPSEALPRVRFNEWFYISNGDTLIEHGNQYDPYCVARDPINPFILRFNRKEVRVPFGNLTTRYLINGMGFFNPHADSNYIMTAGEYVRFFYRYMIRAQPLLMVSWLWGSSMALIQALLDQLRSPLRDPLTFEDRVEWIAAKANATPRMVRELRELFVAAAASHPLLVARELWLDRAALVLLAFLVVFQLFLVIQTMQGIALYWIFIPLFLFLPFFIFYSRSVQSFIIDSKEPREDILSLAAKITKVNRIIYGHTHIFRHEVIGPVEHLNSGTWSPAFADVECKIPIGTKTFVWIGPAKSGAREAHLRTFDGHRDEEAYAATSRGPRELFRR